VVVNRLAGVLLVVLCSTPAMYAPNADDADSRVRPNVLFLAVDDLNDWVGCLGGHPQAKTPNIDRLAKKCVLFEQDFCEAPLCNPSRTSVMTGLRPSNTGIYRDLNWFRDRPKLKDWVTIPQYLRQHGYIAWAGEKINHQAHGKCHSTAQIHAEKTEIGSDATSPLLSVVVGLRCASDAGRVGTLRWRQSSEGDSDFAPA
jgi:hypothetical protein